MKNYRIFLAIGGKATPGNNNIWVRNLYDPLVNLGHDVYLFNIDEYIDSNRIEVKDAKERLSNELPEYFLKEHRKKPFEIFFSYLHSELIIPSVLLEIKKHVYTINYSTNYHQFDIYKEVAGNVDFNIYISKIAKQSFDDLRVKSYWMPLAANPQFYKPSTEKNEDVVFIGSVYGPRTYLFWRLLQYGLNLQLYGHGWTAENVSEKERRGVKGLVKSLLLNNTGYEIRKKNLVSQEDIIRSQYHVLNNSILSAMRTHYPQNLHTSLSDDEYVQTLAKASVVINIQESRFNHDYYNHQVLFCSNLRDYEATLCGSFLCTQYSTEIEELFDIDKEIVCYHNEHDLAEKVMYYHRHSYEKEKIAKAGYERSINSHTWEKRFSDFFKFLNL